MIRKFQPRLVALAIFASLCLSSASDARPDVKLLEVERAECSRLDRELFQGMGNVLSVTDVRALLEKLEKTELLIAKCYSPEEAVYRSKLTSLMREDFKAIIAMPDDDQRRTFEAIRSSRYAIQDFRSGKKQDSIRDIGKVRMEFKQLLGERSFYYMSTLDNELYGLIELNAGEKAVPLAEHLLSLRLDHVGKNYITTGNAYEMAAKAEYLNKRWAKASEYALTAIGIKQAMKLPPAECYAVEQLLISIKTEMGDLKDARFLLAIFKDARSDVIKSNAFARAETHYELSRIEEKAGKDAEAYDAEVQGLKTLLEILPRSDPRILGAVNHLRANLIRQKKWASVSVLEKEWGLTPNRIKE